MKYVTKKEQNILEALEEMFPDSSKSTLRSWIKEERIVLDGIIVKNSKLLLRKNQEINVEAKKKFLPYGIKVLYDDSHVAVIQKPAGLLSVSTDFETEFTVHAALKKYYYPKIPQVVHRLDQETSGLMIFALSEKAYKYFKTKFEKHEVEREYTAIVEGHFKDPEGVWSSYLYEDSNYVVHSTLNKEIGKLATTHYKVLGASKFHTWLDIKLETGRKNQIRAHARDAGHPIVGDKKYGATFQTKRLYLHAHQLTFEHPETGKMMVFKAPIPESFFSLVPLSRDIKET